jgi:hypothetical protein
MLNKGRSTKSIIIFVATRSKKTKPKQKERKIYLAYQNNLLFKHPLHGCFLIPKKPYKQLQLGNKKCFKMPIFHHFSDSQIDIYLFFLL